MQNVEDLSSSRCVILIQDSPDTAHGEVEDRELAERMEREQFTDEFQRMEQEIADAQLASRLQNDEIYGAHRAAAPQHDVTEYEDTHEEDRRPSISYAALMARDLNENDFDALSALDDRPLKPSTHVAKRLKSLHSFTWKSASVSVSSSSLSPPSLDSVILSAGTSSNNSTQSQTEEQSTEEPGGNAPAGKRRMIPCQSIKEPESAGKRARAKMDKDEEEEYDDKRTRTTDEVQDHLSETRRRTRSRAALRENTRKPKAKAKTKGKRSVKQNQGHVEEGHSTMTNQQCCPVCLADFVNGQRCLRLPCNHVFHKECISKWFQVKLECPLDKKPLTS